MFFFEFETRPPSLHKTNEGVGMLRGFVGTAFASLDLGVNQYDMLVAGGDMSVGGLSVVSAKHAPST